MKRMLCKRGLKFGGDPIFNVGEWYTISDNDWEFEQAVSIGQKFAHYSFNLVNRNTHKSLYRYFYSDSELRELKLEKLGTRL